MAALTPAVNKLLKEHPSISFDASRNKLKCSITAHEMPVNELAIKQYIIGKRYKLEKAWKEFTSSSKEFQGASKYLVTHNKKPGLLYCKLTMRDVPRIPETVTNHLSSKKFVKALLEANSANNKKKAKEDGVEAAVDDEDVEGDDLGSDEEDDDEDDDEDDNDEEEGEEEEEEASRPQKRRRGEDDMGFPVVRAGLTADDDAEVASENPYGDDDSGDDALLDADDDDADDDDDDEGELDFEDDSEEEEEAKVSKHKKGKAHQKSAPKPSKKNEEKAGKQSKQSAVRFAAEKPVSGGKRPRK